MFEIKEVEKVQATGNGATYAYWLSQAAFCIWTIGGAILIIT
jgi:hypothetical protein